MKKTIVVAFCVLMFCSVVTAQDKPAPTITIPTVSAQDEGTILRLQRDKAQLETAIANLSAQFESCKTMVTQYSDQKSQAYLGLVQAQDQVKVMAKQLDDEYSKLAKPGFMLDQKSLKYFPDASAKPTIPVQPTKPSEGDKKQ